ncbi:MULTISPECIES: MTH938/NDUFAF3 family protein [unclassified Sphingomonas]|uniref:Mth938-like domain-containing protein n=1 Tax=unclassified Sphingomonas TaxID=196159 RepID=UPI001F5698A0|nr:MULTISPECIES: MTH938/NDUFAF3 family protein [unclassified Sphingomonas]
MRMDKSQGSDGPIVSAFSLGGFKVDEGVYRALLLTPERADGWEPPALDALTPEAIAPLLALDPKPEFLLLGTGATLVRPPVTFTRAVEAMGFGIEAMDSRAAARAWAVLRGEGRWIAAALFPLA